MLGFGYGVPLRGERMSAGVRDACSAIARVLAALLLWKGLVLGSRACCEGLPLLGGYTGCIADPVFVKVGYL